MCYFKEKSAYILFIFLFLAIFIVRPQYVYSQIDTNDFDTDPPSIVETFPEDGDTGVPVNSSIKVLFSEFMDSSYDPFSINPDDIAGELTWDLYYETLIFTPETIFNYDTTYQVTIGTQATDLSGNSLEDPYQWSFLTEPLPWLNFYEIQGLSLDQNPVKLIMGDVNGDIWVVLSSSGASDSLFVFNGYDASDFYKVEEPLGHINALEQDSEGKVWIASDSGVHVYDGMEWTHYNSNTDPVFSDNSMQCLTVASTDHIWVGSSNSGIYQWDGNSWTNYNENNSDLTNNWITNIKAVENDYIYYSTLLGGLDRFDLQTNTWTSYKSTIEALSNINLYVSEIVVSDSGNIWAATDIGLLKHDIDPNQWKLFTQIDGGFTQLNSISPLSNDNILAGTETGLIIFDGTNGESESVIMGNVGPGVVETSVDAYGIVWIATYNSLSRYDTEAPALLSFSPSANKKNVSRSTNITLTFSEPMDMDSVKDGLSFSPSISSYTSSISANSTKLTINPTSKLADNKKYTVSLNETATDIQGHPLNETSWSFTTESTAPPSSGPTFPTFPTTGFGFPSIGSFDFTRFLPQTGFGLPSSRFGLLPSTGFGNLARFLPQTGFGLPSSRFGLPSTGFGNLARFLPQTGFGLPSSRFGLPSTGFGNLTRFFPQTGRTFGPSPFNYFF